jgi:hypothetical protein
MNQMNRMMNSMMGGGGLGMGGIPNMGMPNMGMGMGMLESHPYGPMGQQQLQQQHPGQHPHHHRGHHDMMPFGGAGMMSPFGPMMGMGGGFPDFVSI